MQIICPALHHPHTLAAQTGQVAAQDGRTDLRTVSHAVAAITVCMQPRRLTPGQGTAARETVTSAENRQSKIKASNEKNV